MKTYLKIIFASIFIGCILSLVFLFNFKNKVEAKTNNILYTFQVGVYKTYDNALKAGKEYNIYKIVKDIDYYRVIIGATVNNLDFYKKKLSESGISYYVKEIYLNEDIIKNIKKYDELILSSNVSLNDAFKNTLEYLPDEL